MLTEELLDNYSNELAIVNTMSYLRTMKASTLFLRAYGYAPAEDTYATEKLEIIQRNPYEWYLHNLDYSSRKRLNREAKQHYSVKRLGSK